MSYRVEYNGDDLEVGTLDAALDNAKHAIAADLGPVSGWSVEHDEMINDWFVQGVRAGQRVGPTAVVSGPEPVVAAPAGPARHQSADGERPYRISFTGVSAAEVLGAAATWLAARPEITEVSDVALASNSEAYQLRVYYC